MAAAIDTGLEFYRQVLALRGQRQAVLAANIANASTPGFKAVDLDFAEALQKASGGAAASGVASKPPLWLVDNPRHLRPADLRGSVAEAAADSVKYQVSTQVTLDGNSVDLNHEKVAAAANAVDYQAAAAFTSQAIRMLTIAIAGAGPQSSGGA